MQSCNETLQSFFKLRYSFINLVCLYSSAGTRSWQIIKSLESWISNWFFVVVVLCVSGICKKYVVQCLGPERVFQYWIIYKHFQHISMFPQRSNNKFHNLGSPPNATVIWPKYCRYGVKHYIINQSFLQMLDFKKKWLRDTKGIKNVLLLTSKAIEQVIQKQNML